MRDDEIVGYQRLLPTTRPHLLTDVLSDLCKTKPQRGPKIFEWTRFCVAPAHREVRPRANGAFLELAQGVVEWGMAHHGFRKRIGRDEVVALRMSFTSETLATIREARGSTQPVLEHTIRHRAAA